MTGTLGKVRSAILGLALFETCTFGQVEIRFNGSTASPALLQPGDVLTFEVAGPPSAPFAALVSPAPAFVATPYGMLLADPGHDDAALVFDGFDPLHPTYGTAVIPVGGSSFAQDLVPFQPGVVYASAYYIQALVADPGAPGGLVLTNHIVLAYDPPPPEIAQILPNVVSPPTEITVTGFDFHPDPAQNVVRVNGVACPVIAASTTALTVLIPTDARSGPLQVETPAGFSTANPDSVATWLAVVSPGYWNESGPPPLVQLGATILGDLAINEEQDYLVHLEQGDELVAELYTFDTSTFRISGFVNAVTTYFDPFLRIRRHPIAPVTVLLDDDSGPSMTAAVGLSAGSPRYVAPEAEDVVVRIGSQNGQSAGPFLLHLSARPAPNLPVTVQMVSPSEARVGDLVTIFGTGFDPAEADQHQVLLNGAVAPAWQVTCSSLQFVVPPGSRSGPVRIQAPAGTSFYDADRIQSWLCVHGFAEIYEIEGTTPVVTPGVLVRGQIGATGDIDDVLIDVVAGQSLSIECHAWDAESGSITGGALLSLFPLDSEVRVLNQQANVTFAVDQNSGPALGAGLGLNAANPPFTASYTGTFRIRVLAFLGWSSGAYVLAINPGP